MSEGKISIIASNLISSVFFIGYVPFAPGTWGSIASVIFICLLGPSFSIHLLLIVIVFALGLWSSERSEQYWGKDSSRIVIDEFMGQMIAMLYIPLTLVNIAVAFVLFRFFDILKPYPIRDIERRLKGGWAVMLDDAAAGLAANLTLQLVLTTMLNGSISHP